MKIMITRLRNGLAIALVLISSVTVSTASGQECALGAVDLCVDAGHGGAQSGALTHIEGYDEKDINLQVVLALKDTLEYWGCAEGYDVTYTRLTDVTISLDDRADIANSHNAATFISVHHNSDSTCQATQGSETWFGTDSLIGDATCTGAYDDSLRDRSDLLARKIFYRLRDEFHYNPRGAKSSGGLVVLNCSKMISTLTETSFIAGECFNGQVDSFYYDYGGHRAREAHAIYDGWSSAVTGQGFGIVEYEYYPKSLSDDGLEVELTIGPQPSYVYDVPYEGVWKWSEVMELDAIDFQLNQEFPTKATQDYQYTFHHWEEKIFTLDSTLFVFPTNPLQFSVWWSDDHYHYFVAYFRGGPFHLQLNAPAVTETEIQNNQPYTVKWFAPEGVENSCSLFVDFSSNNGVSWQPILGPEPYNFGGTKDALGEFVWNPPAITASECFLRLTAYDYVENVDTLVSHRFALGCFPPVADFEVDHDYGEPPLQVSFLDNSTHEPTSWYWDFGDGNTSTAENPVHTYDTSGLFTVSLTATNSCGSDQIVKTDLITATCQPIASFGVDGATTGPAPLAVSVYNLSFQIPYGSTLLWDLGDGTTSNSLTSVYHTYACPGVYPVSLTVTSPCGTDDTVMTDLFVVTDTLGSEWTMKEADGYSAEFTDLCEISDGSIIAVGGGNANGVPNILVAKYAECGFADWKKTFNRVNNVDTRAVVLVSTGGILIAGNYDSQVYLLRLDENGDSIWARQYGDNVARDLIECSSGGFLTVGWGTPSGGTWHKFYALRTDALGNPLWENYYGVNPGDWYAAGSAVEIDAGRFVIGGAWENTSYAVCVDEQGAVQWSRGYDVGSVDDICFTTDSKIAVAMHSAGVILKKLDLAGNVLSSNSFYAEEGIGAFSIIETKDLGFLISGGATLDDPALTYIESGYLLKAHYWGDSLWFDLSTPTATSKLRASIQTADGTIRSVGFYSDSAFADTSYAMFMKTDMNERTQCCNGIRGNVNYDPGDGIDIADITYLNNYAFKGGPAPPCFDEGNVNGIGPIDIADFTYLVSRIFKGGPPPPSCP